MWADRKVAIRESQKQRHFGETGRQAARLGFRCLTRWRSRKRRELQAKWDLITCTPCGYASQPFPSVLSTHSPAHSTVLIRSPQRLDLLPCFPALPIHNLGHSQYSPWFLVLTTQKGKHPLPRRTGSPALLF